jgi:hypothetical protein
VWPAGLTGEILKLDGAAMNSSLARLFGISLNNAVIPSDQKIHYYSYLQRG